MKKFSIETLAQIIKAEPTAATGFFTGVSIDSRTTQAGDCFFALTGENFNGADFLADAFAKGAACAVVSSKLSSIPYSLSRNSILKVDDTVKALGNFACQYRKHAGFKVVAITGSVGKTTTRQIAYHVLSQHFRVFQAPKNFNNNIGLPLTLLGATSEDEIVIAELASNHPGEIAYLTRIALPDIAVITNVCPAHLQGLGDIKTIIQEKLSISEGLQGQGDLIINADFDQLVSACQAKGKKFITFGKSTTSDIRAQNITCDDFVSRFSINGTQIDLPLPGAGNVENALAAWAICKQFGITLDDFAGAVRTLPPVPMRAELLQIGTLTVLNDCYNANPASMKNALDILANLGSTENRRLVFICGDMAELGQQTQQFHAQLGASIANAKVRLLLTVGKFAKIAAETAKENAKYDLQTESFKDTLSACNNLERFIKNYDIILVKGSRVAKLELAVEKLNSMRDTGYWILDKNEIRESRIKNRDTK